MDLFLLGLQEVLQPQHIALVLIGVVTGLVFGTIPGLSGVTAVALLVPFTYHMSAIAGLLTMVGIYVAATCAGSLAGIMFNMPGDAPGAATARDGFPLTRQGQARRAISIAIFSSFAGGIIGTLLLALVAPQFIQVALTFGSPEYFALALLGLTVVASIGTESQLKALIAVLFGLFLATVGADPIWGIDRFTFGEPMMRAGIDFIPAIIGFFALSEIFTRLYERHQQHDYSGSALANTPRFAWPAWQDIRHTFRTILRSSILGNIVGMLPGAGATIAAFLGYGVEAQVSRKPEKYGKGELRGVAAPESANNAAVGGAMVPLLTLGIPGSATAAVMISVFILHGLQPGPLLFRSMPELSYAIIVGMMFANVFLIIVGAMLVRPLIRILTIRFELISVVIITFCVIGTFALNNRIGDVWVMFACGVFGFFTRRYGYPAAAIILGLVLGGIAENGLVNGLSISGGSMVAFVTRPVTSLILGLGLIFLLLPIYWSYRGRKARVLAGAERA